MHELVFAEEILDTVTRAAEANSASRILRVRLQMGKYSGLDPSSLLFCLESISTGTPLEHASIEMEDITAESVCPQCGATEPDETTPSICSVCGGRMNMQMINELHIKEIELDVDDN